MKSEIKATFKRYKIECSTFAKSLIQPVEPQYLYKKFFWSFSVGYFCVKQYANKIFACHFCQPQRFC